MDRPLFFVRRSDRLAARIKAILYSWRFSRQVGGYTIVGWLPRDKSPAGFLPGQNYSPMLLWDLPKFYAGRSDLFFMEGDYRTKGVFDSLASEQYKEFRPNSFRREDFIGKPLTFFDENPMPVYQFVGETRNDVVREVRELYPELPIQPYLTNIIQRSVERLGDVYTGLHIRRGDVVGVLRCLRPELETGGVNSTIERYLMHAVQRTAPLEFYEPAVEAALERKEKIVVFTDTPETVDHFQKKYGARSIIDGTRLAAKVAEEMQRAFIDLTLLTRANRIISTQSNYSTVAVLLGRARIDRATAKGSIDVFSRYLYDEILEGAPMERGIKDEVDRVVQHYYSAYDRTAPADAEEELAEQ